LADDRRLMSLLKMLAAGRTVCGARMEEGLLAFLFGEAAGAIRSSALVPLGSREPHGVLALGSHDPNRFHEGQGTVYLTRLGELLAAALARRAA
jgi:hypothetical protein